MLVPGNPLSASLLFVPGGQQDQLLALRTLISELASLTASTADPIVRGEKLNWWRRALLEELPHPALQAMEQSGAVARVSGPMLLPLLESISHSLTNPRFERFEQLWAHCRSIGGQAALLERRLIDPTDSGDDSAEQLGTSGYLLRVVRDLPMDAREHRWLVPLDLQAQFQIARSDALQAQGGPGWDGMVRTLVERAVRDGDVAQSLLGAAHTHLHLCWALDRRLAGHLARRPGAILKRRILPGHAGNVWTAWRTARHLARRMRPATTG